MKISNSIVTFKFYVLATNISQTTYVLLIINCMDLTFSQLLKIE